MKNKIIKISVTIGSVIFWVLLWHILASAENKNLFIPIPLPADTLREFTECIKDPTFIQAVKTSLVHILSGFVSAVGLGVVCGLFSGSSVVFKSFTAPIAQLIRSVPVAAFIVLAWLWIPSESMPSFIAFLMVFPIVWIQIENGLLSVDKSLVEMARAMGMSQFGIILNIKIPTVLPSFRNACITGLGFAWKSGVAAEVLCNPTGSIGALLSNAKSNIDYPRIFALVLTIVILSLILENIIKLLWREKRYD